MKHLHLIIILSIIALGIIFRFYNLNWGSPFYFHPDERNIASSVSQLRFPNQMNPHFFAYGSLPIYTIYFSGIIVNLLTHIFSPASNLFQVSFENAILISRWYSAIFSSALIGLLYFIGKEIKDRKTGVMSAILCATNVGLIQFSHFGTFEIWLTFWETVLLYVCLKKDEQGGFRQIAIMGILSGMLVSIKISHIVLLLLPIFVIFSSIFNLKKCWTKYVFSVLLLALFSIFTFIIISPFTIIDQLSFQNTMRYEGGVAIGTLPVFYTQSFSGTIPVVFQFFHIYPFLLNPLLTLLFIPSFFFVVFKGLKNRNLTYLLLATCYLLLFLSQAFFYAKWTRYMIPTLPFIILIVALSLNKLIEKTKKYTRTILVLPYLLVFYLTLHAFFFTYITYFQKDTREQAVAFAKTHIPDNTTEIISPVYDMGIVPFNTSFPNIDLINFYDIETDSNIESAYQQQIKTAKYIILPSQRIYPSRLAYPEKFPIGNMFYENLFNGNLGFIKMYQTPCDILCNIIYAFGSAEETASIFDRPTVTIFKRE